MADQAPTVAETSMSLRREYNDRALTQLRNASNNFYKAAEHQPTEFLSIERHAMRTVTCLANMIARGAMYSPKLQGELDDLIARMNKEGA